MSISTRTGDNGTTGLMYNRRVPKTHPRIEACGAVDELNAALGMARSLAVDEWLNGELLAAQKNLVVMMGEMATELADWERYAKDGFALFDPSFTLRLDALVKDLEAQSISFNGWATPGATPLAAALDVARAACRRAERRVCALREANELRNSDLIIHLNRLSDALWLLARWAETRASGAAPPDKE
jgi:cob(I)alamin adenosyltransferase